MKFDVVQPFIRTVSLHPHPCHNTLSSKVYDARLFYIVSGAGSILLHRAESRPLTPGTLLIIPPGVCYRFDFAHTVTLELFTVSFDFTQEYRHNEEMILNAMEDTFLEEKAQRTLMHPFFSEVIYLQKMESILPKLLNMLQEYRLQPKLWRDSASTILKSVFIDVARTLDQASQVTSKPVQDLLDFLHMHYFEEISYQTLADHFSYHPYYLNRCFKQETGRTIFQYLQEYRLSVATSLIGSDLSMEEIAYRTGFKNPSHFSTCFRRHYGKPPREYKK